MKMKSFQRDVIQSNEKELLEKTRCGEVFLSIFSSNHILHQEDIENIQAQGINHGNIRMSKAFYTIIVTRTNAYDILLQALRETKQTGVLEILNQKSLTSLTTPKQGKIMKFIELPDYMHEFDQLATNVMIISSKDCKITCGRILEHTPHAIDFTLDHFLNSVSTPEGLPITTNIAVVNCEDDIDAGFREVRSLASRIVLVTSVGTENLKKIFTKPKKSKIKPYLAEDNFTWDDLKTCYQKEFQTTLSSQLQVPNIKWFEDDDVEMDNIIDHINGKDIQLFNDTLPEKIQYYIPRRVISRRIVTNEIFNKGGTDIYLFENIERHKLTELAGEQATETSTTLVNSANSFNCKFIVLDKPHHFDYIKKKYDDRPVHMLYYQASEFLWKRSSGSIHNIQTSLTAEQTVQHEDDFVDEIISSNSNRFPVCISDTPGMGKSVLLAHFTRILRERTNQIVFFVVITEFVNWIQDKKKLVVNKKTFLSALAEYLGKSKLGVTFINSHPNEIKELMFDGFDELNSEDISLGYTILNIIQTELQQTRIWVTTRPHMFLELEKNLVVLGTNIQSFAEQDQISFFRSFWCRNDDSVDDNQNKRKKLDSFAMACLASLKSAIDNKEEDIAGVPLQCMLIGEVFENEAKQYYNLEDNESLQNISSEVSITSMVNLYEKLIENKIDKYHERYGRELDSSNLIKMHTNLSIWLLFPRSRKFGEKRLCLNNFSTNVKQLFDVGILESRSILPAPRFIHRTFAEYFLAKFVVDSLAVNPGKPSEKEGKNKKKENEDLRNFLFTHVLKTIVSNLKVNRTILKTYQFKNYVVCYFINALLPKMSTSIDENIVCAKSESQLVQLTEACAYNDFYQIYKGFAHKSATHVTYKQTVFTEKFLKIIINRGSVLLFDVAYHYFKECNSVYITDIKHDGYTLLHFAVIRGNFSLVENLVIKENFKNLLITKDKTFGEILHECVQNTKQSTITVINDKISIISYLTQINQDFLFQENAMGDLPIECKSVNSTLVEQLFICGGDGYEEKSLHCRILHKLTKNLSSKEYASFMLLMFSEKDENMVREIVNSSFNTSYLLDSIFGVMEPENELMDLLKLYGVDFTKNWENSVLYLAVKYSRNAESILWILNNTDWNNDDIIQALRIKSGSIFLITSLLECKHIDVTNFPTLFHFICDRSTLSSEHVELIQQLISMNVDVNCKDQDSKTAIDYLFKSKCDRYSLEALKLLQAAPSYNKEIQLNFEFENMRWIFKQLDATLFKDLTKKYVTHVEQISTRDISKNTLLHIAAQTGNIDKIKMSFSFCPDINASNTRKETALHLVTNKNCIDCWKFLVDKGADIFAVDWGKKSPLNLLKYWKHPDASLAVMHVLTNFPPNNNYSVEQVLWHVIQSLDLEVIKCACEWYKTNFQTPFKNVRTKINGTPSTFLDAALESFNGDVLEYVLKHLKCSTAIASFSDSIFKCMETYFEEDLSPKFKFIKVLTKNYSNLDLLNCQNCNGIVPLSAESCNGDFVQLFVELGADINARDAEDNIPLHCVIKRIRFLHDDDLKLIEQHIKCGANVNAINKQQQTPFLLASKIKDNFGYSSAIHPSKLVNLLINNNADPYKTDSLGNTILHLACEYLPWNQKDFLDILKCLLDKGYYDLVKSRNNDNCTPWELVKQKGVAFYNECLQIIAQHGIDV